MAALVNQMSELSSDPGASHQRCGYEYRDHMSDIAVHSWGDLIQQAMEQSAIGIIRYMAPHLDEDVARQTCSEPQLLRRVYEVEGHDLRSLFFAFLDHVLYIFHAERFVSVAIVVTQMRLGGLTPTEAVNQMHEGASSTSAVTPSGFSLQYETRGCLWVDGAFYPGTEVKAITMHGMNIVLEESDELWHAHVVVDI